MINRQNLVKIQTVNETVLLGCYYSLLQIQSVIWGCQEYQSALMMNATIIIKNQNHPSRTFYCIFFLSFNIETSLIHPLASILIHPSLGREWFNLIIQYIQMHRPVVQPDLLVLPESANQCTQALANIINLLTQVFSTQLNKCEQFNLIKIISMLSDSTYFIF